MDENAIKEQIQGLKSAQKADLEARIGVLNEKINADLETKVSDKVDKQLKSELSEAMKSYKAFQEKSEERLNAFEAELQKGLLGNAGKAKKSFADLLAERVSDQSVKNGLASKNKVRLDFPELTGKAVGTITPAASFTGEVVPAEYKPGIIEETLSTTHVRDLLGAGSTSSSVWRYIEQTAGEGAFGNVAAGGDKPQIDYDFEAKDANVRKIAGFARVAEEVLEDVDGMPTFLARKLSQDLRLREDNQFLFGDGTGQNLTGLSVNAATFTANQADSNATIIDLIISVMSFLEGGNYMPNGILLNPRNWWSIYLAKDSTGAYLMQQLITRDGGMLRIGGVPVFKNTAVTVGTYFVGDWIDGAEIRDRKGLEVRFFEQDADNVTKNLVTIVAEERLAFPIYKPESFVYGNILTDINKIKNFT